MGNYEQLKQSVSDVIKTNGNQEITGSILQNVLLTIISTVGANATFAGIATPTTNPGTPDGPVFYLASESGTYTNFNSIELQDGLSVLSWNGSWSSQQILSIDDVPTAGSDNFVKSGGVYESISQLEVNIKDYYCGEQTSLESAIASVPTTYQKGGITIHFSLPNTTYNLSYSLTNTSWSTAITDWTDVTSNLINTIKETHRKKMLSEISAEEITKTVDLSTYELINNCYPEGDKWKVDDNYKSVIIDATDISHIKVETGNSYGCSLFLLKSNTIPSSINDVPDFCEGYKGFNVAQNAVIDTDVPNDCKCIAISAVYNGANIYTDYIVTTTYIASDASEFITQKDAEIRNFAYEYTNARIDGGTSTVQSINAVAACTNSGLLKNNGEIDTNYTNWSSSDVINIPEYANIISYTNLTDINAGVYGGLVLLDATDTPIKLFGGSGTIKLIDYPDSKKVRICVIKDTSNALLQFENVSDSIIDTIGYTSYSMEYNGYISDTGDVILDQPSFTLSDYIPCELGDKYEYIGGYTGGYFSPIHFYSDNEGNGHVRSTYNFDNNATVDNPQIINFEIRDRNAKYFRVWSNIDMFKSIRKVKHINRYMIPSVNTIEVAKDGSKDYTTISEAIKNIGGDTFDNPVTIIVHPGVYHEYVLIYGTRHISIVGTDKERCILKYGDGNYEHAPLRADGDFHIANMTIIADYDDYVSSIDQAVGYDAAVRDFNNDVYIDEGRQLKAGEYCIHIDDASNVTDREVRCVVDNCNLFNYTASPCLGMGMHPNHHILIKNCEIMQVAPQDILDRGDTNVGRAIYAHGMTVSSTHGEHGEIFEFINNVVKNNSTNSIILMQLIYSLPEDIKYKFYHNSFVIDSVGKANISKDNGLIIDPSSTGNNISELNGE